ncbi:VCBS repeat-containing protein [Rhodocytophaga aerolata]|uniref:VCBS repeat-containing protein n=1 Tax=Rhodocytophaga aerolata TaxID=455078 RepID=A0ABT8R0W1_9BACT|nr:VCBS repeat-containing protein [Rhodocytophaga aerolata]MDO1444953.1 VCBS repeat-containing protein [Rhodocytophaga aerolata]
MYTYIPIVISFIKMYRLLIYSTFLLFILLFTACKQEEKKDTLFSLLPASETGIAFINQLTESEEFNVLKYGYFYNGGGVAIGDLNNDGLQDIYFTGNMVGNRLYLNKGELKFENITESAGVAAMVGWKTGVTMADLNADGLLDIYVCRSGSSVAKERENLLYINQGNMRFTEQAAQYGLNDTGYSTQAAFFDYDNDGDLDMWLLNHSVQEYAGFSQISAKLKDQKNPLFASRLLKNEGGKFTDVSEAAGLVNNVLSFGLGIGISDFNKDGWPDVYISNDYNEQDYLYLNQGNGTFSERLKDCIGHTSLFSMGVDVADVNNDGWMDVLTLDMLPEDNFRQKQVLGPDNYDKYQMLVKSGFYHQNMRNMLQLNNGPMQLTDSAGKPNPVKGVSFSEIGQLAGVSNTDWSWAPLFADFNNDGHQDLFISNGYARDYTNMDFLSFAADEKMKEGQGSQKMTMQQIIGKMPSAIVKNYIYENKGDLTFAKQTEKWGLDQTSISTGAAYADLDNDGDLDLVVNNTNEAAFVYQNNLENQVKDHRFLKVKLIGEGKNKQGIGATVQLICSDKTLVQEMMPTRGFQSSVPAELVFGLGTSDLQQIQVTWPSGKIQTISSLKPNQTITLQEKEASLPSTPQATTSLLFTQLNTLVDFTHQEENFVDFKIQRLLPNALSAQGPHIAKGDVNGDGRQDLFVCGARGQESKLFLQKADGTFHALPQADLAKDAAAEDTDASFFDADGDKDLDLLVVSGGYCFPANDPSLQPRLYVNDGKGKFIRKSDLLPSFFVDASCVRPGDVDGDGDVDLFIGGRVIPGQYPKAPESYLLVNNGNGQFTTQTDKLAPQLKHAGMVTDALWLDVNGDKTQDLVVVGEWMPITLFINQDGKLVNQTSTYLPQASSGWWNRILAEDFDNDGDLDLVAGNLGLNNQMKVTGQQPATLLYSDFDNNGTIDPVLSYYIEGKNYPAFSRDELGGQMPAIKKRFTSYEAYAKATMEDVFSKEQLQVAQKLTASRFHTTYFENNKGLFTAKELPIQAQFAPVYAIQSLDINSDGHLDILLGGNLEKTRVVTGKYDASYGTAFLGDGKGNFTYLPQAQAGLHIRGDVRDIVVLEQGNQTKVLFAVNNDKVRTVALNKKNQNMAASTTNTSANK